MGRRKNKIGTIDSETDPFLHGRVPKPFAWGFYLDGEFVSSWGKRCTDVIVDKLHNMANTTLYAHNGGKFDFHFLLPYANHDEITIINGRIAKMQIGSVVLKDSFLLMPFALELYKKTEISYKKFEEGVREKHRAEITRYLRDDCVDLYDLLTGFHKTLGNHLTIGKAAFDNMRKLGIKILKGSESHDARYRQYYFGGRTQAFEYGHFKKCDLKYVDINSAYPHAMTHKHPHGNQYTITDKLPRRKLTCEFIKFTGRSIGALPVRDDDGILHYPVDQLSRTYHTTGWELQAGLDTNTIKIDKIHQVHIPDKKQHYKPFVNHFYKLKNGAKKTGDHISELAYKFCLNSGGGKFATDPRKFKDYKLAAYDDYLDDYGWDFDIGDISVWSRSAYDGTGFFDVAVGASITGFVRAKLWRALQQVTRPMYCDTDSIICGSYSDKLSLSDKLGDWSLDAKINKIAIAGKKLYTYHNGEKWQNVSKGARLTNKEIISLCAGKSVEWKNDAPTFSIKYGARFVKRDIVQIRR